MVLTNQAADQGFLRDAPVPPPVGSTHFSLERWDEVRDRVVPPKYRSELGHSEQGRLEFLVGAALMGLRFDPDADPMTPGVLKPQQLLVSDLLDVPHDEYVFEIPRRASKTTSILLKLLGRCALRPGYNAVFTAQNGVAGSRRFTEWKLKLDRINPQTDATPPWLRGKAKPASRRHLRAVALFGEDLLPAEEEPEETYGYGRRPSELLPEEYGHAASFRMMAGEVGKGVYWANGSQLLKLNPDATAIRGDATDAFWMDEAQDVDTDDAAELFGGLKPTMDTRPGACLIISGTAGPERVGPLWEALQALRDGGEDTGGCDYTAGQYEQDAEPIDWDELKDEARALELVAATHPGVGTLTTVDIMRKRYRDPKIPLPQWAREYLSIWPRIAGSRAIAPEWWTAGELEDFPKRPKRVAFGRDIKPGGEVAAIAAAWRDDAGIAYVELVEHLPGTDWVPRVEQALCKAFPGSDIAYDDIQEGRATTTAANMLRPKPRLKVQTYRDHAAGCTTVLRELQVAGEERTRHLVIRHPVQRDMTAAIEVAAQRTVRDERGLWLWTTGPDGGDVTPLVAATRALRHWDLNYAGKSTSRRVVAAR